MRRLVTIIGCLVLLSLLVPACAEQQLAGQPTLPRGMESALVPNVAVSSFVFAAQESPTAVSPKSLPLPSKLLGKTLPLPPELRGKSLPLPPELLGEILALPSELRVDFADLWLGTGVESVAGSLSFATEQEAKLVFEVAPDDYQKYLVERQVFLVRGPKGKPLDTAIASGDFVAASSKYADIWPEFNRLPQQPPGRPIAAGFLKIDEELIKAIMKRLPSRYGDIPLEQIAKFSGLQQIIFGAYAEETIRVTQDRVEEDIRAANPSAIFLVRTMFPSFLVNTMLKLASGQAEIEEVSVGAGLEGYHVPAEDFHMIVSAHGKYIYASVGLSEEGAKRLLASALAI